MSEFIMRDQIFSQTIDLFRQFEEVDAIILGGSRATGKHDSDSDYDVYVYLNRELSAEKRSSALAQTCNYMEINNTYWEMEDDCTLSNGINIELIYRSIEDMTQSLVNTLENHNAQCGYTTCICYNIFTSQVLYDPKGLYSEMVERFIMPYPEPLRQNIILKNRELLDGKMPSYLQQVEKAFKRNDIISINHRKAEFLASYFDILFALNRTFHPGEKRLIELSNALCECLPVDFESDMHRLFVGNEKEEVIPVMRKLISNLDDLLK
jgi:predicted nucleotidyltransferase